MKPGIYKLKEEFCSELEIPQNQYDRRQKELFEWLQNFYDFEIIKGRPLRINVKEVIGEYAPMPRKIPEQTELTAAKKKDYQDFTIAALGTEYKPNSKTKVARDAINAFGRGKYHHSSYKAVAKRYVKKPFDEYGETNNQYYWVWYSDYEKLTEEQEIAWRSILRQEEIAEDEASNAFYKAAEGEDITEEINRYKQAQNRMVDEYGDFPVRVREWRMKIKKEKDIQRLLQP